MTSTNFNIGLSGEKNSSRVLRPPGGSHSDIFGLRDVQNDIVTPSKKRVTPLSTIGSCFKMEDEIDQAKELNEASNKELPADEQNEIENKAPEKIETTSEEISIKKQDEPVPVTKRGRVPPGGFSSGLW